MRLLDIVILTLISFVIMGCTQTITNDYQFNEAENLVLQHAKAWETGNYQLFESILHEDLVFAYPGRRLNKSETLKDFLYYNSTFNETRVYINKIIIDGNDVAVEWQFASTNKKTGNRTAVSDAIIGRIQDGRIIVWKEYLDGRVSRMQIAGNLSLEEGEEPFPWPKRY